MGLSNAERQARWRAKREAAIAALRKAAKATSKAEITEGEVAELRRRISILEIVNAGLNEDLARERTQHATTKAKARKFANASASLPEPGSSAEAARQIESLNQTVRELRAKNAYLANGGELSRDGKMPMSTYNAVVKCLHPDSAAKVTAKDREVACGLLTQWKRSQKGL
jgi:hypothetical protein